MTTIERYRFLRDFYGNQRLQLQDELDVAQREFEKWNNLLVRAEAAAKIAEG